MIPLFLILAFIIMVVAARRKHLFNQDDSEFINICRACFEERFDNLWLGLRTWYGACQACHQNKVIDRYPMKQLHRRDEL